MNDAALHCSSWMQMVALTWNMAAVKIIYILGKSFCLHIWAPSHYLHPPLNGRVSEQPAEAWLLQLLLQVVSCRSCVLQPNRPRSVFIGSSSLLLGDKSLAVRITCVIAEGTSSLKKASGLEALQIKRERVVWPNQRDGKMSHLNSSAFDGGGVLFFCMSANKQAPRRVIFNVDAMLYFSRIRALRRQNDRWFPKYHHPTVLMRKWLLFDCVHYTSLETRVKIRVVTRTLTFQSKLLSWQETTHYRMAVTPVCWSHDKDINIDFLLHKWHKRDVLANTFCIYMCTLPPPLIQLALNPHRDCVGFCVI